MSDHNYNWQRFWRPRGTNVRESDEGYAWGPGAYNPNAFAFDQIAHIPCLGLLGEPGIGKSRTLEREFTALRSGLTDTDDRAVFINLRSYGDEDRLARALFESPEFTHWVSGSYRLHLFLDSLDECLLRIDTVAAILADELKKYSVERLFLRVACRTAEYPKLLDNEFKKLWGETNYEVYELNQLQREDVVEALRVEGHEPEQFLHEVRHRRVGPFAAKPVTLRLLIDLYRDGQQLPSTQAALYEEGCRALCEEPSESRVIGRPNAALETDRRMVVAARIAAVAVLANRAAILTNSGRSGLTDEDLTVRELVGESEEVNGTSFEITEDLVRETLTTALFNLSEPGRLRWAHQTYAEYLAAWYLSHHRLNADQVMKLLTHPDDPAGKLVPQLYETAAWAATLMPELFRRMMVADADVVLRSDVASVDERDRAALVETLLRLFEEESIVPDWERQTHYRKLAHARLSEQLRPYINDAAKDPMARRTAIQIAHECELRDLEEDLLRLALDPSEKPWLRERAADAVGDFGGDEAKSKLKPLAMGDSKDDPKRELKGYALIAVWPRHMTAQELFATLEPPAESFFGSYYIFLSQHFVSGLRPTDLPTALAWIEGLDSSDDLPITFRHLTDEIMQVAWEHFDIPGVVEAFSRAAFARLKRHDDVVEGRYGEEIPRVFADEVERRRRVLEIFLTFVEDPEKDWRRFIESKVLRVFANDRRWLIERLLLARSENARLVLLELIRFFFAFEVEPDDLRTLQEALQANEGLRRDLEAVFYVGLNTPEAVRAKTNYDLLQKWSKREDERPLISPSPAETIEIRLRHLEEGQILAWWWLTEDLSLGPRDTHYTNQFEADITTFPNWLAADESVRKRIVVLADRYVHEADPQTSEWLGTNSYYHSALGGYRALRLLQREAPDKIERLEADVWAKWVPIILTYPRSTATDEEKGNAHRSLIKRAYSYAPEAVIECLMALIDISNEKDESLWADSIFGACWDSKIAEALLAKVKDPKLRPRLVSQLFGELLKHEVPGAQDFAQSLVLASTEDSAARELGVTAARHLMAHAADAGWPVVWKAIQHDETLGREVSESLEYILRAGEGQFVEKLSEDQLADYYIWLSRHYPHAEDPVFEGAHFVGPRESLATWRDAMLRFLKERGTTASVVAIERIVRELPHLDWLRYVLLEAQQNTRRRTWVPFPPAAVIALASRDSGAISRGKTPRGHIVVTDHLPAEWAGRPLAETPNLLPLLDLYAKTPERLAVFTGAGLSVPLFPTWSSLLEQFVNECDAQGKLHYDKSELQDKIKNGEGYLDIADSCALALGVSGYRDFIRRNFNKRFRFDDVPLAYRELLALEIRVLLTTNWDRIPEIGGRGTYNIFSNRRVSDAIRANADGHTLAMLMHGEANDAKSLVFTREDYDQLIFHNEQPLMDFLKVIFMSETVLFLGFSFSDPHLDLVLGAIHATNAGNVLPHYVLLPNISPFNKDALERRFGIRVIPYMPTDDSHPEVLQFIRLLSALKTTRP